jgi:superfamily I DNA/RNA helicase
VLGLSKRHLADHPGPTVRRSSGHALTGALCHTLLAATGFTNKNLRVLIAGLLGSDYRPGQMAHDLRQLRLAGLIRRLTHSNRYVLTQDGLRIAVFYTKIYNRLLMPLTAADQPQAPLELRQALRTLDRHVDGYALDPDYSVGMQRALHRQIDFDSMAPLATSILEASPVARAALAQTYGFVFLDEFQDCTRNQYNLVYTAFHGTTANIIAVGDVKQRIMRFAGALDGVLGQFATDFAALPLLLYLNFRAQPRLRLMQNAMIRVMEPQAALDDAELAGAGGQVDVQSYADSGDEARALADQINTWITVEGVPANAYARLTDIATSWYTDEEPAERTYAELRRTIDDARRKYRLNEHGTLRALVS